MSVLRFVCMSGTSVPWVCPDLGMYGMHKKPNSQVGIPGDH